MTYVFGFVGFCVGFYAGLMMLKPAMRRYSNQELMTDKQLAKKVGWIPWVIALLGMALGIYAFDILYFTGLTEAVK